MEYITFKVVYPTHPACFLIFSKKLTFPALHSI